MVGTGCQKFSLKRSAPKAIVDDLYRSRNARVYDSVSPTIRADRQGLKVVCVKEATKKGYAEAEVGDSVNIGQPNSKTRRGRVGKQVAQTLTTAGGNEMAVVVDD